MNKILRLIGQKLQEAILATSLAMISLSGSELVQWNVNYRVDKYASDEALARGDAPVEVVEGEGNLLTTLGANALWTALTGGSITVFSNANAYLGVGDSSTAASAGQTDLQASSNKLRVAMDATYPTISTNAVTFRSTYSSGQANFDWNEWAVFNASSSGTMLNRKVAAIGTKASGAAWTFTVTISLA